jgi:hypothetical protein
MSEWRTDAPEVGRWVECRCGEFDRAEDKADAWQFAADARRDQDEWSWRYLSEAEPLGIRVAWLIAFVQHIVPLGIEPCSTEVPE